MSDIEIGVYLPCPIPVSKRAFAFLMPNDSMAGSRAEKPILKDWAVFVDPDVKPEMGQLALASINGAEPILGTLIAHGGRTYVQPSNSQFQKEEVDPDQTSWCIGRAVFVGFSV